MLEYETLERAVRVLTGDPIAEVAKRFELDPRRVRILPTGVLLLEKLSELLGQPLQIGKGGLREGVILDLLNGAANGAPTRARRLSRRPALDADAWRQYADRHGEGSPDRGTGGRGAVRGGGGEDRRRPRRARSPTTRADVLDVADIERVHDMRVATRRLRAALEIFEAVLPGGAYAEALREVKALADALGERRDRDVTIAALERLRRGPAGARPPGRREPVEQIRAEQAEANEDCRSLRGALPSSASPAGGAVASGSSELVRWKAEAGRRDADGRA